jgi:hypothetical protein
MAVEGNWRLAVDFRPCPPEYPTHSRHRYKMIPPGDLIACDVWRVERRNDGALLVRVQSRQGNRSGDPQYYYWEERFQQQIACETLQER